MFSSVFVFINILSISHSLKGAEHTNARNVDYVENKKNIKLWWKKYVNSYYLYIEDTNDDFLKTTNKKSK